MPKRKLLALRVACIECDATHLWTTKVTRDMDRFELEFGPGAWFCSKECENNARRDIREPKA